MNPEFREKTFLKSYEQILDDEVKSTGKRSKEY